MTDRTDNTTTAPVSTADEVVETEVKVAQRAHDRGTREENGKNLSPVAEKMAEELYKNLSMGCDAYMDMLPRVEDNRIKTHITAAMCYYEKQIGKVKQILLDHGAEPVERGMMAKMATRAGIAMNTAMDGSTSHIAEMLIEGATMSITTAEKLANHAEKDGHAAECAELVACCRDWVKFEQHNVEALKKYL